MRLDEDHDRAQPAPVNILGRPVPVLGTPSDTVFLQASRGEWEPETFAILQEHVHSGCTYVDLGAHFGVTLFFAAAAARAAYGFEPDPVAFADLAARLPQSPDHARITVLPLAVASHTGKALLCNKSAAGNSASSFFVHGRSASWEVETVRLDEFIQRAALTPPIFIKMDIEGAEYEAIPSSANLFRGDAVAGFLLSLHPFIYLNGRLGGKTGPIAKLRARAFHFTANLRVFWALRHFAVWQDATGTPIKMSRVFLNLCIGRAPLPANTLLCLKREKKSARP